MGRAELHLYVVPSYVHSVPGSQSGRMLDLSCWFCNWLV